MLKEPSAKYRPFPPVHLPDRQWPNRTLTRAPIWCSVDLRDGNQALAVPMNVGQKLELFQTLVKCGFKEIEVGFPSASNTEFTFNRRLIEENRAPGRRLAPGARAGARGFDRAHLRVAGRRQEGHHSPLQLHLPRPAPGRLRHVQGGNPPRRRARRQVGPGAPAPAQGHRGPAPVFARELQRHRGRVRQGGLRGRHGRLEAHARSTR